MKRTPLVAAALAVALVFGASIAPASAYFTDTTQATGAIPIKVGTTTEIQEWYADRTKHVTISNSEDSATPVWVRARVYSPVPYSTVGQNWPAMPGADGWFVYPEPIAPGAVTSDLEVTVTFPPVKSDAQPDGSVYGDNVNVIVVYESTPAYLVEGTQTYAQPDWQDAEGGT